MHGESHQKAPMKIKEEKDRGDRQTELGEILVTTGCGLEGSSSVKKE